MIFNLALSRSQSGNSLIRDFMQTIKQEYKKYLFSGLNTSARRHGMMYSLLGTCKINDVEPFDWLSKVLSRIPDHSIQQLEELLPQNLK